MLRTLSYATTLTSVREHMWHKYEMYFRYLKKKRKKIFFLLLLVHLVLHPRIHIATEQVIDEFIK